MSAVRPLSPVDGIRLKDDFYCPDAVTDALIGELDWEYAGLSANASTISYLTQLPYGVLRHATNATAQNDGAYFRLFTDGLVFDHHGGGFAFKARLATDLALSCFRIGLDDSITITAPGTGIWVNCAGGVITLECYSNDHGDSTSAPAAGVSTFTSGTTMVVDTWHEFEVLWHGENAQGGPKFVELFVDGEIAASSICNIDDDEEVECKIIAWDTEAAGEVRLLDLDYYEFWQWRG